MRFIIASLAVLCLYAHAQNNGTPYKPPKGSDGKQFALGRQGPTLQICEGDDCQQAKQHVNFRLSKLVEVSASNQEIDGRFVDLESIQFAWTQPVEITMTDKDGGSFTSTYLQIFQNVSLFNSNANNIVLNFTVLFVPRQVEMRMHPQGNLTVDVPPHAVKFYLGIMSWPFQSVNNSLRFIGKVKCKARNGAEHPPPQRSAQDLAPPSPGPSDKLQRVHKKRFSLDDSTSQYLDSPTAVLIDGKVIDNAVQMGQKPIDQEMAFIWTFPYFKHSMSYDPAIAMASSSSSQATSSSRSVLPNNIFLFVCLAVFAFLLV